MLWNRKSLNFLWLKTDYVLISGRGQKAVADVEKAVVEALDKQYADVLLPLKDHLTPKKFGLKYVQKLAKRSASPYNIPDEVNQNLCRSCSFSSFKVAWIFNVIMSVPIFLSLALC